MLRPDESPDEEFPILPGFVVMVVRRDVPRQKRNVVDARKVRGAARYICLSTVLVAK